MKKRKILAVLLLAGMLCGMASCGSENTQTVDTTAAADTTAEITSDKVITLDIPDDIDYEGQTLRVTNTQDYVAGKADGDVVSQAEYDMIRAVEEKLNVKFEFIDFLGTDYNNIPSVVQQSVNAGSDDYDMVFCPSRLTLPLVNEGYFLPVSELTYVDLEKPWWASDFISAISPDTSKPSIMTGGITYNYLERLGCVFFNERVLGELKDLSADDLYNSVLDNNWTIDKFSELCKDTYMDLNGNSERDTDDMYAMTCYQSYYYERMAYSSGLEYTERDSNGYPVLKMNNERTVNLIEKLNGMFFSNENVIDLKPIASSNQEDKNMFAKGNVLFMPERFYVAGWDQLRSMDDDFGIIPFPKYDETIDGYRSVSDSNTILCTIPITANALDAISAAAETMAYYGQEMVSPVYYETALKIKYTRDDLSSMMIDLITQNARTDFLYFNQLGGLGGIFTEIYNTGSEFSSLYASLESAAITNLETMIQKLN